MTVTEEIAPEPMTNEITEVLEEQALPQEEPSEVEIVEEQEYSTLRPITKT